MRPHRGDIPVEFPHLRLPGFYGGFFRPELQYPGHQGLHVLRGKVLVKLPPCKPAAPFGHKTVKLCSCPLKGALHGLALAVHPGHHGGHLSAPFAQHGEPFVRRIVPLPFFQKLVHFVGEPRGPDTEPLPEFLPSVPEPFDPGLLAFQQQQCLLHPQVEIVHPAGPPGEGRLVPLLLVPVGYE